MFFQRAGTGRIHAQIYLEFRREIALDQLRRLPGLAGAHCDPRRGTAEQAQAYCSKEESRVRGPFSYGTFGGTGQGARNDLTPCKRILDDRSISNPLQVISQLHFGPFIKFHRGFLKYVDINAEERDWKTEVFVLYGATGTGKSYWANRTNEKKDIFIKQQSKWWCLYSKQPTVILEEWRGWLPWGVFLQMCDENPLLVETKNGQVQFLARQLLILTNDWPDTWYKGDNQKFPFANIKRRVNHWIYCHKMIDDTTPNHVDCGTDYQLFVDEHNKNPDEIVYDF